MRIYRYVVIMLILMQSGKAFSQFSDSTHYYIKYGSTGSINKTNDGSAYLLNNGLSFKISRKKVVLNTDASYLYGQQNGDLSNNDVSASMNVNFYPHSRRFYYWGLTSYDKSFSLKINNRFQGGAGVAYNVFNKPEITLNVSDGILFEHSDLLLQDTIPDKYQTFRNSLRIYYKWTISSIIIFEGTQFWQPSLQYSDDYIIKSNNAITLKLRSWLGITAALNYNRLNRTNRENLFMNYGLTMEKYF